MFWASPRGDDKMIPAKLLQFLGVVLVMFGIAFDFQIELQEYSCTIPFCHTNWFDLFMWKYILLGGGLMLVLFGLMKEVDDSSGVKT